jgi:oligoribonuclease (3'-5' exoribonuclease)
MIAIDRKLIDAAEKITGTDYNTEKLTEFTAIVSDDALELMIEELIEMYKAAEEKFSDYVKEVDEFYKPINTDPYEFYGVSPQDF